MNELKNFSSKDFIDQIKILQEIENKKVHDAIPDLFELCKESDPLDPAVFVAQNSLRSLLLENEEQTVKGLLFDDITIKNISLQVCCQKKCPPAAPVLLTLFSDLVSDPSPELTSGHPRYSEAFKILSALSLIQAPETLELFRQYIGHNDSLIASLAVKTIGIFKDAQSIDALCRIIKESEADDRYEECDMVVASAIDALAVIDTDKAVSFLAAHIHHRNPIARRIIHEALTKLGPETIPFIAPFILNDDTDLQIMAASLLGDMGDHNGAKFLADAVDKGRIDHPNVRFVVYEALGKIPSPKSLACLTEALSEQDPGLLIAVMASLNHQINPGVMEKIKALIQNKGDQGARLIQAVVASKALNVFEALYDDETIAGAMINAIGRSNNTGIMGAFSTRLKSMGGERPQSDAVKISSGFSNQAKKKILIVDDSKSMLLFYHSVTSDMGMMSKAAENGRLALDILEKDHAFDLILTDLNMPVMTGIELTRKVRANALMNNIPIVMVTTESDLSQLQLAKKAGATDFIKKPFTADQLQNKINKIL